MESKSLWESWWGNKFTLMPIRRDHIEENYFNNDTYLSPELILERVLNEYTNNKDNQNIGSNSYYANYQFVHSYLLGQMTTTLYKKNKLLII